MRHLKQIGKNTPNPIIIMVGVGGVVHSPSIQDLLDLWLPNHYINTFMISTHQNAIKYLSYFVLNKCKLEKNQTHVFPP